MCWESTPFERTRQLAAKGTADRSGASQTIRSHIPTKVRAWKTASVYAIVRNTDAGDRHINKTAVIAFCSSLRTCLPILYSMKVLMPTRSWCTCCGQLWH